MNRYFQQMILSASPVELIRLLYQRAIASVRDAREHLKNGMITERSASINNAYEVVMELLTSLRPDEAPELAARLSGLYCYIQERLLEANFKQSDQPLAEVVVLLTTLAEAWTALPETAPAARQSRNPWAVGETGLEESARVAVSA
jgi:flagellar protein FliS